MSAEPLAPDHTVDRAELYAVPDGFDVQWQLEGAGAVVRVSGELDLVTAPRFGRALMEAAAQSAGNVIVDFTDVRFFDAGTLGVLAVTATPMRQQGKRILLRGLSPFQKRLLRICELDHVMLMG